MFPYIIMISTPMIVTNPIKVQYILTRVNITYETVEKVLDGHFGDFRIL